MSPGLDKTDAALLELLQRLRECGYAFTAPAPATHRRVLLRRGRSSAQDLRDVFGWNLPFRAADLDPDILWLMHQGNILCRRGGRLQSCLRVASVGDLLFVHSAFPPQKDSVFFGPDSYRFCDFIRAELPHMPPGSVLADIGAGSGVGGLFAHSLQPAARLVLGDVSPQALRLARINAAAAGQSAALVRAEGLPPGAPFDVILANPPYIGGGGATYSDSDDSACGAVGGAVSIAWARQAAAALSPGGRFLLYTGAAMLRRRDPLREALAAVAQEAGCTLRYRELDPDVFPWTLRRPSYWGVERIAAVGATIDRPA